MYMRYLILISVVLCTAASSAVAQFGYGLTAKTELYSRYKNPPDGIASPSAGSALLNIGLGPKLWFGGDGFAISPEAAVVFSPFALSSGDYKGLGAVSFPIMVKAQFAGLSNFNRDGKFGFSIGGGIQYTRTELFGLDGDLSEQGVDRSYFRTYIIEADFGFGLSGFNLHGLVRYGFNTDLDANTISIGVGYDFNIPCLKEALDSDF